MPQVVATCHKLWVHEYIENDDRSTSYFLNLEKRNHKMKHIKQLNISESETIEDHKRLLQEDTKY